MTEATRKDLEWFIKELETMDANDLPSGDFQGKTLDTVQWGVYQRIVKLLEDLPDKSDNILTLDYLEAPHPADKMATVTVSITKNAMFTAEEKLALAGSVMICDRWYVMASDSKVRLSFVVGNIWKEENNHVH
jgi:hypothetical protein